MDPATLMASAFAGFIGYFVPTVIIWNPKKVFYSGLIISGLGILATAFCIIYSITVDISGPVMLGAVLIHAFTHGNTLVVVVTGCVATVLALVTGMLKK